MENILKEILVKFDNLQGELTEFKQQSNERFDKMDSRLDKIETRQAEMSSRFDGIDSRLDGVGTRLNGIDSRLDGMDSRLDEHYQLLRSLEHASEVHKADMDNLTHQIAHLSQEMNAGFKELTEISKSLLEMYGEHEAEIRTIKRRY